MRPIPEDENASIDAEGISVSITIANGFSSQDLDAEYAARGLPVKDRATEIEELKRKRRR